MAGINTKAIQSAMMRFFAEEQQKAILRIAAQNNAFAATPPPRPPRPWYARLYRATIGRAIAAFRSWLHRDCGW